MIIKRYYLYVIKKIKEEIIMEKVVKFLKEAETYYLATIDGDQARVRPFVDMEYSFISGTASFMTQVTVPP